MPTAWRLDSSAALLSACGLGPPLSAPAPSAVFRVLAVLALLERGGNPFVPPALAAGPPGIRPEEGVPLLEVPVDGGLGLRHRRIVAVVNDRSRQPVEHRLDDVEELGAG